LDQALDLQKKCGLKIGKCLLKLAYLSERKLLTALSEQLKVPFMFGPILTVSEETLRFIPKPVCKRFHIVPFDYRQNHILSVAVDIDLNEEIVLALQEVLECSIQPYLTTRKALQQLLVRFVLPLPEEAVTLICNDEGWKDQMGRIFLEEWTFHHADRARFASLEDMIWIRYLAGDEAHDQLLVNG
jgi:type IV pilus assembly protein PilB